MRSPEYVTKYGLPKSISALSKHQCLSALEEHCWPLKTADATINGWLTINDHYLLKQQAIAGKGIIRVAHYYVDRELQQGTLQKVLEDEYIDGQSIYILYPQLLYPTTKLKAFIAFVQERFAS